METIQLDANTSVVQTSTVQSWDTTKPHPGHKLTAHTDTLQLVEGLAVIEHDYVEVHAPPPSGGPALPAGFGYVVGARVDPGDAAMLNPASGAWNLKAHGQANGLATKNDPTLAKYGQSSYGGPVDQFLHCSTASGRGVWMVGPVMPAPPAIWICEFELMVIGRDAFHAYGWNGPWVLDADGGVLEVDLLEFVNWGSGVLGYASTTYHDGSPPISKYIPTFPFADGKPHKLGLLWDPTIPQYNVLYDGVVVQTLPITLPQKRLALQITTGYTAGTVPPNGWGAASDSVYGYARAWQATKAPTLHRPSRMR